ncbi:MAG: hypothetical protein RIR97_1118 [Pseudomonadota bacterium]
MRDTTHPDWLVGNPSGLSQFSALWMGSAGLLVLGLQPILLGSLFNDGRVTFDQLALVATVEILCIGLGSVIAAFFFAANALPVKSAILLIALIVFNGITAYSGDPVMLTLWRTIAGLLEGGLVAISVELIARSRQPERFGGYFVTLQTGLQCLSALILSQWVVPFYGSKGGFVALACFCALSLSFVRSVPEAYGAVEKTESTDSGKAHALLPVLALLTIFCFYLFLGALWAFLEPLGGQSGISATVIGLMVSLSLLSQLVGAVLATWAERRIDYRLVLFAAGLTAAAIASILAFQPGLVLFWICVLAIGFIWLFVVPYQIALTIVADENRKTALLVPAAQLFGAAIGPVGASLFLQGADVQPVPIFAGGAALASLVFLTGFIVVLRSVSKA